MASSVCVLTLAFGSGYLLNGLHPSMARARPAHACMVAEGGDDSGESGLSKDFASDEMGRLVCAKDCPNLFFSPRLTRH